jgi:transcriptional regulator with XRE-family HTH domain
MKNNIHIGSKIKQKMEEKGFRIIDFAKAIHCNRTNVYSIFNRKSLDLEQLLLISEVLEYDFISEYTQDATMGILHLLVAEIEEAELRKLLLNPSIKVVTTWKLSK